MKRLLDVSLPDATGSDLDLRTTFEKLWREVQERESRAATPDFVHHQVRLDCNGELVDIGAVRLAGPRESPLGRVLIEFVCPRCKALHELSSGCSHSEVMPT